MSLREAERVALPWEAALHLDETNACETETWERLRCERRSLDHRRAGPARCDVRALAGSGARLAAKPRAGVIGEVFRARLDFLNGFGVFSNRLFCVRHPSSSWPTWVRTLRLVPSAYGSAASGAAITL